MSFRPTEELRGVVIAGTAALLLLLSGCQSSPLLPSAAPTTEVPATAPPTVELPTEVSATDAPTSEPVPTDTPEPTATETAVPTPTPTDPMLEILSAANCRGGPGVPYEVLLQVRRGRILPLVGQSTAFGPLWWKVSVDATECWIWNELGRAGGRLEGVPILPAPPTPTPRPTPIVTPTPTPVGIQFSVTISNQTTSNVCFLFIVPAAQSGWGRSVLPSNFFLPPQGKLNVLLSSGRWNFRAEDCKDDVVEILVDRAITADTEWVIGP